MVLFCARVFLPVFFRMGVQPHDNMTPAIGEVTGDDTLEVITGAVCLGVLDRNGDLEILVAGPTQSSGGIYAYHHDGKAVTGFPWLLSSSFYNGVTLGDLNSDGTLDVAASGRSGKCLYAWTTSTPFDPLSIHHGAYRVNRHNSAVMDLNPVDGICAATVDCPASTPRGNVILLTVFLGNDSPVGKNISVELLVSLWGGQKISFFGRIPLFLGAGVKGSALLPVPVPASLPTGGYRFLTVVRNQAGKPLHTDAALLTVM